MDVQLVPVNMDNAAVRTWQYKKGKASYFATSREYIVADGAGRLLGRTWLVDAVTLTDGRRAIFASAPGLSPVQLATLVMR